MINSKRWIARLKRQWACSSAAFLFFRYRYLLAFTLFGFLSILVELAVLQSLPSGWSVRVRSISAFIVGLFFSFLMNATFNFRVPAKYFVSTFLRFSVVSLASFVLNSYAVAWAQSGYGISYSASRIVCSGALFLIAYAIHRKLTFNLDRNFGIAVYASPLEHVRRIFLKVGRNCDHIHIDLVDSTYKPNAEVDLGKIAIAKRLWPDVPFAIHLMSRKPTQWVEPTLQHIDWYLFSLNCEEALMPLIAKCHLAGKRVGVVWHVSDPVERLYEFLSHVEFVMVLGIEKPGQSGQQLQPAAIQVVQMLDRLRHRYRFDLMFDGSVNSETIASIPARYVIAASSVLKAERPAQAIYTLKTGARHERTAA